MVSHLRRLAADHADLHNNELPPNYLFPNSDAPDDLTQLTVLLTGPYGTPYSAGLWRLHLKIPEDYPQSPPKAFFKTRIWHPNVEETTGAVCVDTLKRDWEPKLTLRDILVTISCLLIHPNPDSALNSAAGALLQEDYEAFARQAKLMTSIHAPIPQDMREAVMEAKRRGEDPQMALRMEDDLQPVTARKSTRATSLVMKKKPSQSQERSDQRTQSEQESHEQGSDDEDDDSAVASKENDPSLSPSPVRIPPPSPRKNVLGKRPLSVLATPIDTDIVMADADEDGMTPSEKNTAANNNTSSQCGDGPSPRKSPKLSHLSCGPSRSPSQNTTMILASRTDHQGTSQSQSQYAIYEDGPETLNPSVSHGKENLGTSLPTGSKDSLPGVTTGVVLKNTSSSSSSTPTATTTPTTATKPPAPNKLTKPASTTTGPRKVSGTLTNKASKPRVGLRRL
ncbi:hypothetical protein VTN77DRAFT_9246 [Rasamsonia byssochlamydoides]|uniref:uncharacterized protein n=1 Tax=Rasamsonia byssochlamydoides TaxID=89139 RepID=UPI0037433F2B